jgi:hypothetical protein
MKKMILSLIAMLTIALSASAMSYEQARNEALFLTDKMAYELNLTDAQYEAAYEINLDYLMGVTSRYDVYGSYWERRNLDLQFILYSWQWDLYRVATYFYRPLYWNAGHWHFGVYARYPHRDYFYFGRPHFYTSYRGGHSWRMNGGRSYYEHHRDHFRPHIQRDHHFGMRDGWNRGDFHGHRAGSSTRITSGQHSGRVDGNRGRALEGTHRSSGSTGRATEGHNGTHRSDATHGSHGGASTHQQGTTTSPRSDRGNGTVRQHGNTPRSSVRREPSARSTIRMQTTTPTHQRSTTRMQTVTPTQRGTVQSHSSRSSHGSSTVTRGGGSSSHQSASGRESRMGGRR